MSINLTVLAGVLLLRRRRKQPRMWMHPMNHERLVESEYYTTMPHMRRDEEKFFKYLRMESQPFDELLHKVTRFIEKKDTVMRVAIEPELRLVVTLRYLASGMALTDLARNFRLGDRTCRLAVLETCDVIWDVMHEEYLPIPDAAMWTKIADRYYEKWNFPNCIGSLDGKHVMIEAPPRSGSLYFNYKGSFSMNLMAVADADYRFILVDVGSYGSNSDGGVFNNCSFGQQYMAHELNVPPGRNLPGDTQHGPQPFVLLADEAFPARVDLLRPYPRGNKKTCLPHQKRVFNYRLSRGRRVIENTFGVYTQRWRVFFNRRINLDPDNVLKVMKATVVLHNYLTQPSQGTMLPRVPQGDLQCSPEEIQVLQALPKTRGMHASREAIRIRDEFKEYFNSPDGSVPWQDGAVNK